MDTQLAWRNIWRNPRRTAVILTAIFIGVTSMIFLAALMRGMMEGMVENAIENLTGHIKITDPDFRTDPAIDHRLHEPDEVLKMVAPLLPEDAKAVRRVRVDAVVNTARESAGVVLVGIVPDDEIGVSFIGDAPLDGRFFEPDDANGLVIGHALLEKIGLDLGDKVVLMSQDATGEVASRAFRIRGTYRAEMASTEKAFVFAPLPAVQEMLKIDGGVTEIAFSLPAERIIHADVASLTRSLNGRLSKTEAEARQWREMLPAMDAYLGMFDAFLYIWYLVIFVAMGFGIVNTVLMAVYERMREFGLLMALGMRGGRIFTMVLGETLLLLLMGMGAGNLAGFALVGLLAENGINLSAFAQGTDMWGIDRIIVPLVVTGDVAAANATVLVLGLAAGIYPALRATRFTPVETMRRA